MKSHNTSLSPLRRALVAATVVLATGSVAALAQSSDRSPTQTAPSTGSSNDQNQNNNATTNPSDNATTNDTNMSPSDNAADKNSSDKSGKLSWSDKRFLTKTAKGNEDEIKLAQLAVQQASNPDVRNFAQRLVSDHTKLNQDLQTLASNKDMTLKGEEKEKTEENRDYKKLAKATGTDFDRQFIDRMVSEHKKDIKAFQDRADDSKDADVKSFVQNALPTLQQHLQTAQQLQQSVVPTGRTGKESWKYPSGNTTETGSTSTSATGATSNSTNSTSATSGNTNATSSATPSTGGQP